MTTPPEWYQPFTQKRARPVSNANELTGALSAGQLQAGDEIILAAGVDYAGIFKPAVAGTESYPIRITGTKTARILGALELPKEWTQGYGVEVTKNPAGPTMEALAMDASNVRLINCYAHDTGDRVGLRAFNNNYKNQAAIGCILKNTRHQIYAQNDYVNGMEFYVGMIVLDVDASIEPSNAYNLHLYTEGNHATGFRVFDSIFANGTCTFGSKSQIDSDHHNEYKRNSHYKANFRMGYGRPSQMQSDQNYFGKSHVQLQMWQGEGEQRYPAAVELPSKFTNNVLIPTSAGAKHFDFKTARYPTATGGQDGGVSKIRAVDEMDHNEFWNAFFCSFAANTVNAVSVKFMSEWRKHTRDAGNEFDINSTNPQGTPPNTRRFWTNDYDPRIKHLAFYNWEMLNQITINQDAEFEVYDAYDPYGAPIASSDNLSAIVQTEGKEFMALILRQVSDTPEPQPQPLRTQIAVLKDLRAKMDIPPAQMSDKDKKKATKSTLDASIPELEKCADEYEPES